MRVAPTVLPTAGKHPRISKWQIAASNQEADVSSWFCKWPDAGVGIATGIASGVFVLDVDGEVGRQSLARLQAEHNWNPETLTAITARGLHMYFKIPPGLSVRNSASRLAPGLDVRGEKGFAVCPPSRHESGVVYCWKDGTNEAAEVPSWFINLLTNASSNQTKRELRVATDADIPMGKRNTELVRLAGQLRASGKDESHIFDELNRINELKCKPPLPLDEVLSIARSISSYEKGTGLTVSQMRENNPLFWMQLNIRELSMKPEYKLFNDRESGWYFRLMLTAWQGRGMLEDDENMLRELAGAKSPKSFIESLPRVLFQFSRATDGAGNPVYVNRKMERDWYEKYEVWLKKQEAGKASAESRRNAVKDAAP